MTEQVGWGPRVVVIAGEPAVAILVDVDAQWVPGWDDDPHADVELALHDQHWILDVLLDHPRLLGV